jgi:hypothetical protein
MSELLPCPFCGSTETKAWKANTDPWQRLQCAKCNAVGPVFGLPPHDADGGEAFWNTRTLDVDKLAGEILEALGYPPVMFGKDAIKSILTKHLQKQP